MLVLLYLSDIHFERNNKLNTKSNYIGTST